MSSCLNATRYKEEEEEEEDTVDLLTLLTPFESHPIDRTSCLIAAITVIEL